METIETNKIIIGDYIKYINNGEQGEGKVYEYFNTGELRVNGLLVDFLDEFEIVNNGS